MTLIDEVVTMLKLRLINDIDIKGVEHDLLMHWLELKIKQILSGKSYTIELLQKELNELKEV